MGPHHLRISPPPPQNLSLWTSGSHLRTLPNPGYPPPGFGGQKSGGATVCVRKNHCNGFCLGLRGGGPPQPGWDPPTQNRTFPSFRVLFRLFTCCRAFSIFVFIFAFCISRAFLAHFFGKLQKLKREAKTIARKDLSAYLESHGFVVWWGSHDSACFFWRTFSANLKSSNGRLKRSLGRI